MAVNLHDIVLIQDHLNADPGMSVENVLSDIEELGRRDPTLFTGHLGEDARSFLNEAAEQIEVGRKGDAADYLDQALGRLESKLRGPAEALRVPGGKRRRHKSRKVRTRSTRPLGRRGRTSRRKSLRQRK